MFPKIRNQSWKEENLNDLQHRWSQTWKDLNPDFDYKFWTDKTNAAIVNTYYISLSGYFDRMDTSELINLNYIIKN